MKCAEGIEVEIGKPCSKCGAMDGEFCEGFDMVEDKDLDELLQAAEQLEYHWNPAGGDYPIPEELGGSDVFDSIEILCEIVEKIDKKRRSYWA